MTLYIKPSPGSGQCFHFQDAVGNGNCFYNAIATSDLSPFPSAAELKREMHDRLAAGAPEREHLAPVFSYYYSNSEPVDVDKWRVHVLKDGEWATEFDMVIFACLFGVNIKSYAQVRENSTLEHSFFDSALSLDLIFSCNGDL